MEALEVCSEHFAEDCFKVNNYFKYGLRSPGKKEKKRLTDEAIPTLKLANKPQVTPCLHSEKRHAKKDRQEVGDRSSFADCKHTELILANHAAMHFSMSLTVILYCCPAISKLQVSQ